jgi:eukaryotic-like serine/threonine-protein kinase
VEHAPCHRVRDDGPPRAIHPGMQAEGTYEIATQSMIGPYRIISELGRGGMATVYEAHHVMLPRRAALKVMHSELQRQPGNATRLVQEAAILEQVRHPGIVAVYDCGLLPDRRPWVAMELVEGESLAAEIERCGALPPRDVALLLANVAAVLAPVHELGIIHRDLKPDNILMLSDDSAFPLRVIDWGIARLGVQGRLTLDGSTPGTPIYMAPEQAAGRDVQASCDIYALGVVAYEALTGHPPFDGRTLAEIVCLHLMREPPPLRSQCKAPWTLCALVHRMLAKDPAHRPTASDLQRLAAAIADELAEPYDVVEIDVDEFGAVQDDDEYVVEVMPTTSLGMVPLLRTPRWTPDIGYRAVSAQSIERRRPITPRGERDQVSGEIVSRRRS